MRDKTIIPTNLLDGPRVAELLPELKLILGLAMWGGRYTSSIGVSNLPINAQAASLGLDPSALENGLKTLCSAKLLVGDWDTLEFFVTDWFRFHSFNGLGREIAAKELLKIQSPMVCTAIKKAAPWIESAVAGLAIRSTKQTNQRIKSPTAAETTIAAHKIRIRRDSGIVTYYPADAIHATKIEGAYDAKIIQIAIQSLDCKKKEPVPGSVEKTIEGILKMNAIAQREREALAKQAPKATRAAAADGLKTAWAALNRAQKKE